MRIPSLVEINAFVSVAEHASFAKAASNLGVSASAISMNIRTLEEALGVRLLNRTTRSVALTEIGERFLMRLRPVLNDYAEAVESINSLRDKPAGHLRIVTLKTGVDFILAPKLARFLEEYPEITVDICSDASQADIVADHFDAGIHVSGSIPRDAIAMKITSNTKMVTAGSPAYFARHPKPHLPGDLKHHRCIRYRSPERAAGPWSFEKDGKVVSVPVEGPVIADAPGLLLRMALDGIGIVLMPRQYIDPLLDDGRLVAVLQDWARALDLFLYYPSRRQVPQQLQAFIEFLKKDMESEAR